MAETEPEFELGIYASQYTPKLIRRRARNIIRLLDKGHSFYVVIPPHLEYLPVPKRIIVAGGEGSIRTIMQMLYDKEEIRPVGLLPGGSQNVLYNALLKLGLKSDAKTFLERGSDQRLRLGMIGDKIFINHVGIGPFEYYLGEFNKRLRFLQNGQRPLVCAFLALVAAALSPNRKEDILNLYTITPTIGKIPAFPGQNLLDENLTHARVTGVRGLVTTLLYWQMGKPAPDGAMTQLSGSSFAIPPVGNYIWLDGDTVPYVPEEGALIKRTPYGIPMVAII